MMVETDDRIAALYDKKRHSDLRRPLLLALGCFLAAGFLWFCQIRLEQYELAQRIAPKILRFHVIANSNSKTDQELKLKVKSFLIEQIYSGLNQEELNGKAEILSFLSENGRRLEMETEELIRRMGKEEAVSLTVGWCEFPEKAYGDIILPAGRYEAAQVRIGKGMGHNWWCVLYPRVCITKDAVAVVPESSQEELKELLSEKDYLALQSKRPVVHMDFQLRRLFDRWLNKNPPDATPPALLIR